MRISDAMRLGAKKGPQLYGHFTDGGGGTCAMGAVTTGCIVVNTPYAELEKSDDFKKVLVECPVCGSFSAHIHTHATGENMAIHLNDRHRWTREAIADWIDATYYPVKKEEALIPAQEIMSFVGEPAEVVCGR